MKKGAGRFHNVHFFFSSTALKNLLTGDTAPHKVIEKNLESISNYNVLMRDDSMVLYAPPLSETPIKGNKKFFEIILYRPASETVTSSYRYVSMQKKNAIDVINHKHIFLMTHFVIAVYFLSYTNNSAYTERKLKT